MVVDPSRLEAFMGKMIGHMTGARSATASGWATSSGLYRELAGTGPRNADSVADQDRVQPAAGAGVARRPGGRRAGRLRPGRGHLRVKPRGGDGPGRRRLARFRGPGDERRSARCSWTCRRWPRPSGAAGR